MVVSDEIRFTPNTDNACNKLVVGKRNPAIGELANRSTSAVIAASDFNRSAASRRLVLSWRNSAINFVATGKNGGKFCNPRRLGLGLVRADKGHPQRSLSDDGFTL